MKQQRYCGVIVKCGNKVLLCKRSTEGSYPGMWSIPCGKLEKGETTKDGAKREFFEETSVDIDDMNITFVGLIPRHSKDGKKIKGIMYVYLLEVKDIIEPDFDLAIDGHEHSDWKYFGLEQIDENTTGKKLCKMLKILLKEKK